jgi:hypothetical protein
MAGRDTKFTTSNYLVTTTPRKEFDIATGKRECPAEDMLDRKKRKVRVIHRIDALKTLEICTKAELKDYEILAVVSLTQCAAKLSASCPARSKTPPRTPVFRLFGAGRNCGWAGGRAARDG